MPPAEISIELPERYRVVRHVANGGMASVWAAEDGVLGRLVAVKVLAAHVAADPSSRTRFEREARTAARLSDHPNIATIYDIGEHAGTAFIVMELLPGGTIADRLREGVPIQRAQALQWLEQAAAALDHAHARDVVHRDVKPANLLLDERSRLCVGDFGIARLVDETSLTQAGQVLGTAAYLSPEQALGQPATAASDRYSLAVVAFELLAGRRPFVGEHAAAQARQHVEGEVPDSGLGNGVDSVLDRGLAKDPDDRYPTAARFVEELRHEVERAGADDTAATRKAPPPAAAVAPPPSQRRLSPVAAAEAPEPQPQPQRERGSGGGRRSALLLAGLGAVILAVALAALIAGRGNDGSSEPAASKTTAAKQGDEPKRPKQPKQDKPANAAPAAPSTGGDTGATDTPETGEGSAAGPDNASNESPEQLNDIGYRKLQAGDPAGALPYLQKSVAGFDSQGGAADATQFGYALFNLGQAYHRTGQYDEAVKYYERRLQVNPNDRPSVVRAAIRDAKRQSQS